MKKYRRVTMYILILVAICSILSLPASASSTTAFDRLNRNSYAKSYTLATSGITIPYTSKDLSRRGTTTYGESANSYIDNRSDELYVMEVGCTNDKYWAYVSYPAGNKRVEAYIPLSAISVNNGSHTEGISRGKFNCSLRENSGNSSSYYVAPGDTVYLLGTHHTKYQILYPISGGKWRIAFCNASDYHNNVNSNVPQVRQGRYIIASAVGNNQVLDIFGGSTEQCANVQTYTQHGENNQVFDISYAGNGYYTIKNLKSGMVLDVAGGIAEPGTNVWQHPSNSTAAQHWCFEDTGNGEFRIRSELGLYLDVSGGYARNETNVHIWNGNSTNAQRFQFLETAGHAASNPQTSGAAFVHPMKEYQTQYTQWGVNPYYRNNSSRQYHSGVDYMSDTDKGIYAITDGVVISIDNQPNNKKTANGNFVLIEHTISGKTVYSFYAHLNSCSVSPGQHVSAGTKIGEVGKTGYASNDIVHLHFAIIDYKWTSGEVLGYVSKFSGNSVRYNNVTYYNPYYVIENGKLP